MKTEFIAVDPSKCIGCSVCEYVCAFEKDGSCNPLRSRIRIVRVHSLFNTAMVCRFCENAPCVIACHRNALRQSTATNVIQVNEDRCDGCGWCIPACPYGAITVDPATQRVMVCDLCDGTPRCVDFCPVDALQLAAKDTIPWSQAVAQALDRAQHVAEAVKKQQWQDLLADVNEQMRHVEEKLQQLYDKEIDRQHANE